MGQFGNLVLTTKGLQLQSKAQAGIELAFTRVGFGDGQLTQGQNLVDLTNLINHKITSPITSINIIGDGTTRVRTTLTNKDLIQGFYLREIGLFAQDPDIGEILYAVANAGEYADFLPVGTGNTIVETTLDLITVVGNDTNVTAVINESLTYTTVADLNDAFDTVQQKTLKKIIGTFIASENNTTVFTINESDYNPEVDQCELSYKGITLTKDVNYTQSGAEMTLLFPINLSEQINYNILKFINNSTIKADGSNLQDKSVTTIKLSQDVQDKVNKVPMIRSQLAGLSSKVSDLTGITPQIAKISRFFLNSKSIVSNQSDSFYANCPNPPLGGVFNNLNSSSGSIIASTIDTPATCWALINLLKIYGENNDVATLNRAKLIGNYIVNSIINASFYGALFRVMPNAYTYASSTGWTPVTSIIHVRTQYHAMWALLELYKVTGNVTYKNNAIDLMKTIGNIYNNIKARATTQAEISSWMVGSIYNTIHTDGASPTPNMTFSWSVFNHNTADMLSKAIPLYIQQVGNASINDWEGTAFVPQSIINDFKTFIQYAYNNKKLTMTPTGLPYSFFEYEDTDAKVNNSYEPKPKNYDWITSGEFGDTWFVNDLTLWIILGIANLGLMDIATRYRNAFMKLQISSYPDKVLFHDRYNFDGTSLIDDQSISICATALLYAVDKTLGIVDDELHSVMNDTLLGYQIQSTNLNIDGSYRWDIADSAASIEVKATSEICYNSAFIVGGGVIDSITSQLAEKAAQKDIDNAILVKKEVYVARHKYIRQKFLMKQPSIKAYITGDSIGAGNGSSEYGKTWFYRLSQKVRDVVALGQPMTGFNPLCVAVGSQDIRSVIPNVGMITGKDLTSKS
ncbi:phage tail protein, partial [Clostridium magnum]|uniref:phage tail-collar fiber domain-containing protein n=1 Tax=Clostridium magnum TaxID=33954 RepID=UPI0009183038